MQAKWLWLGALLTVLLVTSQCTGAKKNRSLTVRVPPVVTIGVQPLPLSAALVLPDAIKTAVHREQVWCPTSVTNLSIQTGPAFEKAALQALPQAFATVEAVRDKTTAGQYDVLIEPSAPDVKLNTGCNWIPWDRNRQQAKVFLHVVVTARNGELLLDNTYASEPHAKESPADAVGEAYAEVLETVVHQLATAPAVRAYAKGLPAGGMPPSTSQDLPERGIAGVGFAAGFGYVITNYHVVAGLPRVRVYIKDTVAPATVALRDRTNDVALLRLELSTFARNGAEDVKPLTGLRLGDPSRVRSGDRVWTVARASHDGEGVTEGSIVAVSGPGGDRRFFQVALPLPPGNSGSPLLNEHGEVVGVMVPTADAPEGYALPSDLPRNMSLAVKISYAKTLLGMLPESEFLMPSLDPLPAQGPSALAALLRPQVVLIVGSQ